MACISVQCNGVVVTWISDLLLFMLVDWSSVLLLVGHVPHSMKRSGVPCLRPRLSADKRHRGNAQLLGRLQAQGPERRVHAERKRRGRRQGKPWVTCRVGNRAATLPRSQACPSVRTRGEAENCRYGRLTLPAASSLRCVCTRRAGGSACRPAKLRIARESCQTLILGAERRDDTEPRYASSGLGHSDNDTTTHYTELNTPTLNNELMATTSSSNVTSTELCSQ